jgi:hypothetical protein
MAGPGEHDYAVDDATFPGHGDDLGRKARRPGGEAEDEDDQQELGQVRARATIRIGEGVAKRVLVGCGDDARVQEVPDQHVETTVCIPLGPDHGQDCNQITAIGRRVLEVPPARMPLDPQRLGDDEKRGDRPGQRGQGEGRL